MNKNNKSIEKEKLAQKTRLSMQQVDHYLFN